MQDIFVKHTLFDGDANLMAFCYNIAIFLAPLISILAL
jgi:hypothetical protein